MSDVHGSNVLLDSDQTGATFYIACNGMLAFSAFFFLNSMTVAKQWRASVTVAGLVTFVAWYNYTFMKQQWIETRRSPTTYRYTDWIITVPLQIVEFALILKAAGNVPQDLTRRMLMVSTAMIVFGWLAEINIMAKTVGFICGCLCWLYICYEATAGEAAECASRLSSASARQAFASLRMIFTFGWTIYPAGFAFAYFGPDEVLDSYNSATLNQIYNVADFINKGAFGMCVYMAAESDK